MYFCITNYLDLIISGVFMKYLEKFLEPNLDLSSTTSSFFGESSYFVRHFSGNPSKY
jgi:hypothetical protein